MFREVGVSMEQFGVFDIIGPIMIGPSSSHTAGAVKIGYIAMRIHGKSIKKVQFYLHGSFAKTYVGHGTDRALLSGVMGFLPDDERIKDAYSIGDSIGLEYEFIEADLGEVHPNTVKIQLTSKEGKITEVMGASIGGGKIKILKINDIDVAFDGEYTTLIVKHYDRPGVIAGITAVLAEHTINIAFMKLFRQAKGEFARLIVEMDDSITRQVLKEIKAVKYIKEVAYIEKMAL